MILITKDNVYINLNEIVTMGIQQDKKTLVVNCQPISFETEEECKDVFEKISKYLINTSYEGVTDLREE